MFVAHIHWTCNQTNRILTFRLSVSPCCTDNEHTFFKMKYTITQHTHSTQATRQANKRTKVRLDAKSDEKHVSLPGAPHERLCGKSKTKSVSCRLYTHRKTRSKRGRTAENVRLNATRLSDGCNLGDATAARSSLKKYRRRYSEFMTVNTAACHNRAKAGSEITYLPVSHVRT